jgi:hypothetical protein
MDYRFQSQDNTKEIVAAAGQLKTTFFLEPHRNCLFPILFEHPADLLPVAITQDALDDQPLMGFRIEVSKMVFLEERCCIRGNGFIVFQFSIHSCSWKEGS